MKLLNCKAITAKRLEIVKPISIYHIFRGEKVAENELVGIIYWCKTDAEEIKLSEEHTKYKWVTPEEALEMLEKPGMKRDLEAFIASKMLDISGAQPAIRERRNK